LSEGTPDQTAAALTGHAVVHLYGGLTPAAYDGWAEKRFAPGQTVVFRYPMDQRAALLWYHDHVMGVTGFDVYAGLAGLWIVRDERERELRLPEGPGWWEADPAAGLVMIVYRIEEDRHARAADPPRLTPLGRHRGRLDQGVFGPNALRR
jgi:FtsP/CotA-like multicopper oxidase with cupredoxin domain